MEEADTFQQLPLSIDPNSKLISSTDASLTAELEELNKLHKAMISLATPNQVPPPPVPVDPKRSHQINKLRENGNTSYKKGAFPDAIRMYDLAIEMAMKRPTWEASGLVRDELAALYNNRAMANMGQSLWAEGACDAETSVDMKKVGNVKGWWRRGQCLKEMGRYDEASDWVKSGLDFERAGPDKGNVGELETLARELKKQSEK